MENMTPQTDEHTSDEIIDALLRYKDKDRNRLVEKFNITYLVLELNRTKLQKFEVCYKGRPAGLDVLEFTRLFVNSIEHTREETVYLVVAILELFQEVCAMHNTKLVKFNHLTNFFCQRIFEDKSEACPIKTRLLPYCKNVAPATKASTIEIEAPVIYGGTEECVVKLSNNRKWRSDRYKHYGMIRCAYYDKMSKMMLCLDHLADFIGVYDMNCVLVRKIEPTSSTFKKEINILSFAYSERQERIGAVLKDYSLVFWDVKGKTDNQKMFSITEYCPDYQCSIWYLERHDLWVTGDKNGNIYTWNLNDEKPQNSISLKLQTKVTDLCELPCLNLVALSQQHKIQRSNSRRHSKDQRTSDQIQQKDINSPELYRVLLYNIRQGSRISEIALSHRGIHTLHYSNTYQVLLSCGFETKIDILEINPHFYDISIRGSLVGHQSMITTFTPIENTPMVVSADDKGKIKIWDLRSCKCVQTVDLGDQVQVARLINMVEIGKLGIVGLRINILNFQGRTYDMKNHTNQKTNEYPIKVQFQANSNELIIFTKKDVRFYDLATGTIKFIYSGFSQQDEQIISAKYIPSQRQYVLCDDRGEIKLFSAFNGQFVTNMISHSSEVSGIRYDCLNRLFITTSWDSNILIQKQNAHGGFTEMRRMSDNFNKKQISIMEVSVYHNLIVIGCAAEGLMYFWDYELGKLLNGVSFDVEQEPTALGFVNGYSALVVGTSLGRLHVIRFNKNEMALDLELIISQNIGNGGFVSPIVVDTRVATKSNSIKQSLVLCEVIVGSSKGYIYELDITHIFQNEQIIPHASNRLNYNAEVVLKQNFVAECSKKFFKPFKISEHIKPSLQLEQSRIYSFQAHNSSITDIILVESRDTKHRITTGQDSRVKFWTRGGVLIADSNINMPLPYKWEIPIKTTLRKRDKLILALKILRSLTLKYGSNMSREEEAALGIDAFLSSLKPQITPPLSPVKKQVRRLQDELSRKDLHYDSIKKNNFKEIAGSSLKEMGFEKRIRIIQKSLKSQQKDIEQHDRLIQQIQSKDSRVQQRSQLMNLLFIRSQASTHTDSNPHIPKDFLSRYEPKQQKLQQNKENVAGSNQQFDIGSRWRKKTKAHIPFEKYYFRSRAPRQQIGNLDNNQSQQSRKKQKKGVFQRILSNMSRELDLSKKSYTNLSAHSISKPHQPHSKPTIKPPDFFSTQPSFFASPVNISPRRQKRH